MKAFVRILCLVLCAALLAPALACAEGGAGILYRVTGGKNSLYLLGSIHIGSEDMYPVGDAIKDALAASDTLVLECDTESGAVLGQMMGLMSYPIGETLKDHISAETWELLAEVAGKTGYSIEMLGALRPWAVASMLAVDSTAAEMGVKDVSRAMELGVETQIGGMAGDMPRAYLETAVDQLKTMESFSPELQEYMLYCTLMTIAAPGEFVQAGDEGLKDWPKWWSGGEAERFAASYLAGMEEDPEPELMKEYHQKLLTNRNSVMAEGLRALLEGDEPHGYFAVIGLLHLVLPDDSVASLLEDMGYTVQRVY